MLGIDDAEMLTSEVHDPYTRITVAWKIEQHRNTFKRDPGVESAKFPPKVKSENVFYNSRVLERN